MGKVLPTFTSRVQGNHGGVDVRVRSILDEFERVRSIFRGLDIHIRENEECIVVGSLPFKSGEGAHEITDSYDIRIHVPDEYPDELPRVFETGGRIAKEFHRHPDGSLCLTSRLQTRLIFEGEPTLLGFIRNLAIPFLYGHSFFERFKIMPFGELKHGGEGLLEDYTTTFNVTSTADAMRLVATLAEASYRGHLACPCRKGEILRRCHGPLLRKLSALQGKVEFVRDLVDIVAFIRKKKPSELPAEFTAERIQTWVSRIDGRNGKNLKRQRAKH